MKGIRKAIAAGIVACGTGIGALAGSEGEINAKAILAIVGGTLIAFGTTWKVSNDVSE